MDPSAELHFDDLPGIGETLPQIAPDAADQTLELILSAQAGDHESYRQLVVLHQDAVVRFCFHWLHDRSDAQEAAQDCFVRAWQALDRYQNRERFAGWLYRIALNICRDRHKSKLSRQRRQTAHLASDTDQAVCHRPAPDEAMARRGDIGKLQRGIALLPENLRAVLILRAQEGLSQEQCAEVLNCSVRAVEGRLYRARRELLAWWNRTE